MKAKLCILLLEDDPADAELIAQELAEDGFPFALTCVQTEADFCRELEGRPPDLVLSDYGRPAFDGFKALEITRQLQPRLPFIFISRSNNLGMIVKMYEHGATDYVFTRDIEYLHAAVHGALRLPAKEPPSAGLGASPVPIHFEPNRTFTKKLALTSVSLPAIGHVSFCPRCRQARDESAQIIRLEDYCDSSVEIIVTRRLCTACDAAHSWS